MGGPIPKRSEERRRRNAPARPIDKVQVGDLEDDLFDDGREAAEPTMVVPTSMLGSIERPAANPSWHATAVMLYDSLAASGQVVFMEPSDWAQAYLLCDVASRELEDQWINTGTAAEPNMERLPQPMKAATLAALLKGFAALGMAEGDRRRMSIELKRTVPTGELPEGVTDITAAREGLI